MHSTLTVPGFNPNAALSTGCGDTLRQNPRKRPVCDSGLELRQSDPAISMSPQEVLEVLVY